MGGANGRSRQDSIAVVRLKDETPDLKSEMVTGYYERACWSGNAERINMAGLQLCELFAWDQGLAEAAFVVRIKSTEVGFPKKFTRIWKYRLGLT